MTFDNTHFRELAEADISSFELKKGSLPPHLNPDLLRRYLRAVALWGVLSTDQDGYEWLILGFGNQGPYWKLTDNRKTTDGNGGLTIAVTNMGTLMSPTFALLANGLVVMGEDVPAEIVSLELIESFIFSVEETAKMHGLTDTVRPVNLWPRLS